MYKVAEDWFHELYKRYADSPEQVDEYSSYLKSVSEDGTKLFSVPQEFQTNELILLAFETEKNPVHLLTRNAIDNSILRKRLKLSSIDRKYAEPITEEEREHYLTSLTSLINLKYDRYFIENYLLSESGLYTFFDFFHAVTEFYSGMDTVNYLYLYRGFPIPIRIKKNGRRQNFKLLYDKAQKILSLIKVSAEEYKSLRETLSSKLEMYYGNSSYLDEYYWEKAPTDKVDIPILQDGDYYETFKTVEENGVVYDYTRTAILSVPKGLVEFSIPEGVSSIPTNCFMGQKTLRKVKFPSSLDNIPKATFMDCEALEEVDLSAIETNYSRIIVGSAAFCNCKSLKYIDMKKLKLEDDAKLSFAYCSCIESIAELKFPGGNTQMNFFHCDSLKELVKDPYVIYGEFELAYCLSLNSIYLHHHTIPTGMLCGCKGLEYVKIIEDGEWRKDFGDYCFAGCESIKEIDTKKGGAKIGKFSFADCVNFEKIVISKKDEWYTVIARSAFDGCHNAMIEWTYVRESRKEYISSYWSRKEFEAGKQNAHDKEIGKKAKVVFLKVFEEIKNKDIDKKRDIIGKLFGQRGRYIGMEVLYILKHNVCTWEEYLKLGCFFYECIPFSTIYDLGTIRTAIISWAKSCTIQAYLQAPIHNKFDAIQLIYNILKHSYSYYHYQKGKIVNGSHIIAQLNILNTCFDYQEIEAKATEEQKNFIGKYFSLSDIRMSYLMQLYLLQHLIAYNKMQKNIDWNYEYANKEIDKLSKHILSFSDITSSFLIEVFRHTWQQFIKDDIEKNYVEMGEDCDYVDCNTTEYITYDDFSGEICWGSERIDDSCPEGVNPLIPDQYERHDDFYDNYGCDDDNRGYGRYAGSYVQDEMGWSDDDIDTVLDGDPNAYWNID
ncbi:MAG: leucine-rich repeat protein [Bacteroidales bacterium]|nr:leucine-rich repeat protein [Bacteroidales bacterium]